MITYVNAKAERKGCGWVLTATLRPSGNQLQVTFRRASDMGEFCREHKIELTLNNIML